MNVQLQNKHKCKQVLIEHS